MAVILMAYAFCAAGGLAAIAMSLDSALRRSAGVSRGTWSVALFGAVLLTAVAPFQRTPSTQVAAPDFPAVFSTVASHAISTESFVARAARLLPEWSSTVVVVVWSLSTMLVGLSFALTFVRYRRRLERSPMACISGEQVYVSETIGPAVIGIRPPRIVVPRWVLSRSSTEQNLVVAHERSHVKAGDPLLLLLACAAVVTMPWNPWMWLMLSRLRLAIEVDCDTRLVASGALASSYGNLLIDLSGASAHAACDFPSFSAGARQLEQRLHWISLGSRASTHARLIASSGLAALLLVVARAVALPRTDPPSALKTAGANRSLVNRPRSRVVRYSVNGRAVSQPEAQALKPDRVRSVFVSTAGSLVTVRVSVADSTVGEAAQVDEGPARTIPRSVGPVKAMATETQIQAAIPFAGLLILDDVPTDAAALRGITRDRIESIQVLKGQAATLQYGAAGANGVIRITTKRS